MTRKKERLNSPNRPLAGKKGADTQAFNSSLKMLFLVSYGFRRLE